MTDRQVVDNFTISVNDMTSNLIIVRLSYFQNSSQYMKETECVHINTSEKRVEMYTKRSLVNEDIQKSVLTMQMPHRRLEITPSWTTSLRYGIQHLQKL